MELSAFAKTNTAARLRAAASRGALSHALILSGAGDRNAAAHYAAAALECTGTDKPCLTCAHCRKVLADIHPDVLTVRDDEHAELSVDVIRGVRTDAFIRPNEGARKVYIFEDCTILTEKDQNVLLKLVEVTHNMQQAARISDKTAFFLLGELVEMGDTERLFSTPVDKRTEDYISGRFG